MPLALFVFAFIASLVIVLIAVRRAAKPVELGPGVAEALTKLGFTRLDATCFVLSRGELPTLFLIPSPARSRQLNRLWIHERDERPGYLHLLGLQLKVERRSADCARFELAEASTKTRVLSAWRREPEGDRYVVVSLADEEHARLVAIVEPHMAALHELPEVELSIQIHSPHNVRLNLDWRGDSNAIDLFGVAVGVLTHIEAALSTYPPRS